jgi:hypothetical protein
MDKGTLVKADTAQINNDHESIYYIPPTFIGNPIEPNFFCRGWNSKREKYCRARSGAGTDHSGQGRCRVHGGLSAITHGRYSSIPRGTVAEHLENFELESEEQKLDIMQEATLMRALAANYLERYEDFFQAVIRINQMEDIEAKEQKRKPMFLRPPSIEEASRLLKDAAEVVDRIHKQRANSAVSLKTFFRIMAMMSEIVSTKVKSLERKLKLNSAQCEVLADTIKEIGEEWQQIKVAKL